MSAEPLRTNKATFSATVVGLVPVASATDIVVMQGADGRKIEIDRIEISGIAGTGIAVSTSLIRRSSAASGGTSAAMTPIAHDSRVALTSAATLSSYTANPTVGNAVGTLWAGRLRLGVTTAAIPTSVAVIDSSQLNVGPICLNSASEWLAINLNGTTVSSGALEIYIRWTERHFAADGIYG